MARALGSGARLRRGGVAGAQGVAWGAAEGAAGAAEAAAEGGRPSQPRALAVGRRWPKRRCGAGQSPMEVAEW
eukprot:1517798-Prymnesium_polylepis.1